MKSQTQDGSWIKPAGHPGLIGTVNLLASGFVWWTISFLSIFLFFGGLSALPAAGSGIIFLVAWFYFQWGINSVERHRAESIYSLGYPKPQMPQREPGFTGWLKWLGRSVTSAVFWRGTEQVDDEQHHNEHTGPHRRWNIREPELHDNAGGQELQADEACPRQPVDPADRESRPGP